MSNHASSAARPGSGLTRLDGPAGRPPTGSPGLRVTEVGEYLRFRSCQRRFKLEANGRSAARALPFAERLFNQLDPVLQAIGREREQQWETALQREGVRRVAAGVDAEEPYNAWEAFCDAVSSAAPGAAVYAREVKVATPIGGFQVEGRIDFVLLRWVDGRPRLRLIECKASRRDRTYHRVQVALYRLIVQALVTGAPVTVAGHQLAAGDIEAVVARVDEATSEPQDILALEPLALETESADVLRLLASAGPLDRILDTDLDALPYTLEGKCDGCVFNVHCLPESARQRRLELVGIDPSAVRVLRAVGIQTIDDLAAIDLDGSAAVAVRADPAFVGSLERLKAEARARSSTLPGGGSDPDLREIVPLPSAGRGQLPEHEAAGVRLVRVYLSVSYDYAENRVGALAAHVTTSDHGLHTGWRDGADGHREPDSNVRERRATGERGPDDRPIYAERRLHGAEVVRFKTSEWTGRYADDTAAERELIQSFLHDLVDTIAGVADAAEAPIHFYVWARSEMTQLVEACSRADSRLLGHLRELLGCRESLEQLIYSCLQEEIDRRYALGWTGRGLTVATSLGWFGRRYHWRRRFAGAEVDLDRAFTQDLFDFKTELDLRADGAWARNERDTAAHHKFEVRSRFYDSLTAPYWRAYWRTLPSPEAPGVAPNVANAIRRYMNAARPGYLQQYLRARVHALRWIEEGVRFKNPEIQKPVMDIGALPDFTLGVSDAAQAGIDFLRLDQHVKTSAWVADHLVPVADRVPGGRTLPVRDVVSDGRRLSGTIDVAGYGLTLAALEARSGLGQDAFVRLSPHSGVPQQGQTIGQLTRAGRTCRVASVDWVTGRVELEPLFAHPGRYVLQSGPAGEPGPVFAHATLDGSVSDFVAGRVDDRLASGVAGYVYRWFDPQAPEVPPAAALPRADMDVVRDLLSNLALPPAGRGLAPDQVEAVLDGLETRVQLLQGPPGTGKTTTTAAAILTRALSRLGAGDVILVAAHTHTAVDTLLRRLDSLLPAYRRRTAEVGRAMPEVRLAKVHSSRIDPEHAPGGGVVDMVAKPCARRVADLRDGAVAVLGGTTGTLLKMASELSTRRPFSDAPNGFQARLLVVDEASMMVFPHFLALASLIEPDGHIMLAGDHRQLTPIVAHDWEREDRPPAVVYQPFASAYEAVQNITGAGVAEVSVRRSALRYTFRLPPEVRDLVARLYRLDAIELLGREHGTASLVPTGSGLPFAAVWDGRSGLYLVVHTERESRQANETEVRIVEALLAAAAPVTPGSVGVVTPHRAQRSVLRTRLGAAPGAPVDVVDTVERFQGGERPTIVVSATVSDPSAVGASAEFILNLNRANVAFSRAEERLIVVCSDALLDHIPAELEHYESSMLWKSLRALCTAEVVRTAVGGHEVVVLTPPASAVRQLALD